MCPSKRFVAAKKMVNENKSYTIDEAVDVLLKMPRPKFDQTVEISTRLNADPKQSDQTIRGSVILPHGTGKKVRIIVFCESDKEKDAKDAGADFAGGQDLADKIIQDNWMDFDYCIATPGMMKVVSKLGKVLGPRGLMPSPKTGTVTDNVSSAIAEAKRGKIDFRMDKFGCLHVGVGKMSFTKEQLSENIRAFVEALVAAKPTSIKTEFIKSIFVSASMSPSMRLSGIAG